MAHVLGEDAKLYRNTGTYGSPTWDAVNGVQDLTLNQTKDKIELNTRGGGGYKEYVDGLIDVSISFSMIWDSSDADLQAFLDAFNNKTAVEVLCLDGPSATAGSEGIRFTAMVSSAPRNEPLSGALTIDFELSPVKNANAAPAWYVAS